MRLTYKSAGVNIDAGEESVRRIKSNVKKTHNKNVVTGLGTFGAMYHLGEIKKYKHPILVQSIDGVGTKVKIASLVGHYASLGEDIVNHCCNDIVVQGARPLTFLDYIASFKTEPRIIEELVSGMVKACQAVGVSLIGGETAEMSTVYAKGEHDIAGCITGIVEEEEIITGDTVAEGDIVLGLTSDGLHTNGYSLARKIFFEVGKFSSNHQFPELSRSLGEELLQPHHNYTKPLLSVLKKYEIKGLAHITGGGLLENIPRVLPKGTAVQITRNSWPVLPIFELIQRLGGVADKEMFRVFNMGIGMVMIVGRDSLPVKNELEKWGENVYLIGEVVSGKQNVIIT